MLDTKKYGLLVAGILFLVGALLVGAAALPAVARNQQGNGGTGGMMGGGMMGGAAMGDVDRHFIEQMVPHHQAAVDMADLALQKAQRAEIRTLAAEIKQSQTAEIEQMRTWYRQWYGTDVPTAGTGGWGGMMGGGMMGGGMMGGGMMGDVDDLANAEDLDRAFLEQMVPHHQMALMMTTMVQTYGEKPELRSLAQTMYDVQSDEIEQMRTWYRQWYGNRDTPPTN